MKGININCKRYPFTEMILAGEKIIETRNKPTLRSYVGKRVGIIETGNGRAKLVGYATVKHEMYFCSESMWGIYRYAHRIDSRSEYEYRAGQTKYGYLLKDVVRIEPIEIYTRGIVSREVPEESEVTG